MAELKDFTVIGFWESDQRHVIGVVEGQHAVMGGTDPGDQGLFADHVQAETWEQAEEMTHGSREDGDEEDEELDDEALMDQLRAFERDNPRKEGGEQ